MNRFAFWLVTVLCLAPLAGRVLLTGASAEKEPQTVVWHEVPGAPEKALLYSFRTLSHFPGSKSETEGVFGIWQENDRLQVKSLVFETVRDSVGTERQQREQTFKDRIFQFSFDPKGQRAPAAVTGKGETKDENAFSSLLASNILPLLFVEFPDNYEAKEGFRWGDRIEEDDLATFKSPPAYFGWEVRKHVTPTENTDTFVLESTFSDAWQERGQETLSVAEKREQYLWLSKIVLYDAKAKRIRSASSIRRNFEHNGGNSALAGFEFDEILVNEINKSEMMKSVMKVRPEK